MNRVRFLRFQTTTSLLLREHMKEKWGTDKERTSKGWKMDLSTNVSGNPALCPMSFIMPNTELGALAEAKFQGCSSDGDKHSCLLQAHRLLVWGRASGIVTTFHSHRKGVNSFALGTTADAYDSSSPVLSNNEKQIMTARWASLPEGIAEHFLQSNIVNPMNWVGMEETRFYSNAFK